MRIIPLPSTASEEANSTQYTGYFIILSALRAPCIHTVLTGLTTKHGDDIIKGYNMQREAQKQGICRICCMTVDVEVYARMDFETIPTVP